MSQPEHSRPRRSRLAALGLAILASGGLAFTTAWAAGGSSFEVSTTASASGPTVSGVLTVTNTGSDPITLSASSASLEVRFDDGVAIPPLPAGSDVGWYRVAQLALPASVSIAAGASRTFPYTIEPCSAPVANYRTAKDMRSFVRVDAGRVRDAYSDTYALPAPCPVCGNAILEAGEQCDAGPQGGGCCSTACQIRPNGTFCSDGNACTQVDACQAGACVGADPVVCTSTDACRDAGICNPATGACSQPAKPNGTACNDQNACTRTDTCQAGLCRGANPVVCSATSACMNASCDPATGGCAEAAKPDGTTCSDASACTQGDRCVSGVCTGGAPLDCNDAMSCTQDACNASTGCSHTASLSCEACDDVQCTDCSAHCETANTDCQSSCWTGFWSCLDGCTSTYCAPFCQVDLGRCLESCPTTASCRSACEAGNGCGEGCSGVAASQSTSPQVPSSSAWGFIGLAALLVLIGGFELHGWGRRREAR